MFFMEKYLTDDEETPDCAKLLLCDCVTPYDVRAEKSHFRHAFKRAKIH